MGNIYTIIDIGNRAEIFQSILRLEPSGNREK